MIRPVLRRTLSLFLITLSGSALALGLGELRGHPYLGERLRLEVDIVGDLKAGIDSTCFRLIRPNERQDLPWLKDAAFSVRKGAPAVLEIRSEVPLREPVLQLAIQVRCGYDMAREYLLLASPAPVSATQAVVQAESHQPSYRPENSAALARRPAKARLPRLESTDEPLRPVSAQPKHASPVGLPDRMLQLDDRDGPGPALRLSAELPLLPKNSQVSEAQRELLRLEFRMLLAIREQATTQLETAEKLRNMESSLGDLKQRAAEFAERVEKGGNSPEVSLPLRKNTAPVAPPEPQSTAPAVAAPVQEVSSGPSEWSIYGLLLGIVLGLAGWFGWKRYTERRSEVEDSHFPAPVPEVLVDPKREQEREERGGIDLSVEPAAMGMPMQVDLELETAAETSQQTVENAPPAAPNSVFSTSATTLDEHFEANPVMELADIMLSFGRVKGAAQALQEYIDRNPQEALKPWIRLMDVYRMAGMRAEFEETAASLNQNFNVEVLNWDAAQSADRNAPLELVPNVAAGAQPPASRPGSLEDMPRLMDAVCSQWETGDVVGYLYQLLRDNRGGQRMGFALAVVEEILFLIELKETSNRIEQESVAS